MTLGDGMPKNESNLLEVVNAELKFLEEGNYRHPRKNAWHPQLIFQDSPTCLNYTAPETPPDCSHCPLMELVPPDLRSAHIPCRHIPLNAAGETLETLYESADQTEIESTVARWLRSVIQKLEEEKQKSPGDSSGCSEGNCAPASDLNQRHFSKGAGSHE